MAAALAAHSASFDPAAPGSDPAAEVAGALAAAGAGGAEGQAAARQLQQLEGLGNFVRGIGNAVSVRRSAGVVVGGGGRLVTRERGAVGGMQAALLL
jgi:hypothetical protein